MSPDAVVVGAGPNGLAAALTLARAGLRVQVFEGAPDAGGGCRTAELTLPGFAHDVCSTVHALAAASPFFAGRDLAARGVRLLAPKVAAAHPLDGGRAGAISGSVAETAARLGGPDARAYARLMGPLVRDSEPILAMTLAPLRSRPDRLLPAARFGAEGLLPATVLARRLHTPEARALLAGMAGHSLRPLSAPLTGAFGLTMLLLAHTTGWPVIEGGSARLIAAMTAELAERGGTVTTGTWIERLSDLPPARAVVLDVTPRQLLAMAGDRLPAGYRRAHAPLPVRARSMQGRLGAGRPRSLAKRGVPGDRDGASRRHDRRGRAQRGRGRGGPAAGAAVLPDHPAVRGRPGPGARGQARAVGLLSRAAGVRR